MHFNEHPSSRGFSILELVLLIAIAGMLLALILPALAAARAAARRDACAANQRAIGSAWQLHLQEYGAFPASDGGAGPWSYAGVVISPTTGRPTLDFARPLNRYLSQRWTRSDGSIIFESPVDAGIEAGEASGRQNIESAYRTFGTSYRANDLLSSGDAPLRRAEVTADPSRLVIMGAPFWHEVIHETGGVADWYGDPNRGMVLFFDYSTRMITVEPGKHTGDTWTLLPGGQERNPNPSHREPPGE